MEYDDKYGRDAAQPIQCRIVLCIQRSPLAKVAVMPRPGTTCQSASSVAIEAASLFLEIGDLPMHIKFIDRWRTDALRLSSIR